MVHILEGPVPEPAFPHIFMEKSLFIVTIPNGTLLGDSAVPHTYCEVYDPRELDEKLATIQVNVGLPIGLADISEIYYDFPVISLLGPR